MRVKEKELALKFLGLSEAEIQLLHYPALADLRYFVSWFLSLQLP
jgi:hypothetical protein